MRHPNLTSPKIGQSNTDYRTLDDADLDRHIATLEAKRPNNWTPTAANLRGAREHREYRVGRAIGWEHCGVLVRAGQEIVAEVEIRLYGEEPKRVVYEGVVDSVSSRMLVVRGQSPYSNLVSDRERLTALTNLVDLAVA